jgi:superfamily I DNA/RNA helicase
MARLAVSKDYFGSYARLPRKAQRKADEFLTKFQRDSTALSIHLEPVGGAVDGLLRSARIGDDYRVILRAPESGDVFLVLWADHHDEAYRWAATKQTAVHPATGSLQIFDAAKARPEIAGPPVEADSPEFEYPSKSVRLFDRFSDEQLFLAGVPRALIPSVRYVANDDELDGLLAHLPPEAGEVLTGIAAGLGLDEVLEEVLGREAAPAGAPAPPPVNVLDVASALARDTTQRQFRLIAGEAELDAALKFPLDVWRVFLHPRQAKIARARTKGPTRVLGGAGTGKTVVAIHRIGFLVREVFKKPDDRVLFTTFNTNLAEDLKTQLGKLLEPDELARVDVINIDAWAARHLRSRGRAIRTAFDQDQSEHFRTAYDVYGDDVHTLEFYRAEWREVIQDQGLRTEDEYVRAVRKHRGVPLSRADRRKLWPVFQGYRDSLDRDGMCEPADVLRLAAADLDASDGQPRYRAVVVDEVQDFSADALRLVRAIAGPERPDDLFLVGDAHQRIYRRATSLSSCGIQVRGRRSQTLRLNYRTTGAICRWSMRTLEDVEVDDLDDGKADRRGYVSLREGDAPEVRCLPTSLDEERAVVDTVKAGIEIGWHPESVCIVARTRHPLVDRFGPALGRAGIDSVLLDKNEPTHGGVRLATMHRVKGLEFAVVLLVGMSEGDVPLPTPELRSDDPIVAAQALLREKSLVYVASSRARDELFVFASGKLSPLVRAAGPALQSQVPKRRPASIPPPQMQPPVFPPPAVPLASAAAGVSASLAAVLATQLSSIDLPTRMQNFVELVGIETLGELVRRSPQDLMQERNLGRKTIKDTRALVERLTGSSWERLAAAPQVDASAAAAATADLTTWDGLRVSLTDAQRATKLERMALPARLRNYASREGLVTLGELAERSRSTLQSSDNFGRRSVGELPVAVAAHFERARRDEKLAEVGLLESWKTLLEDLEPIPRLILTRRSGWASEAETLSEIGDMLGVSRERIRQIESLACTELARRAWADVVRTRVDAVLAEGAVALDELASDPWWALAVESDDFLSYVVEDVLDTGAFVIQYDDRDWISRHSLTVVNDAWTRLREDASKIPLPAPASAFDALIRPLGATLGTRLARELTKQLHDLFKLEEAGERRVVALGHGRHARLLALLRVASKPIRMEAAEAHMGGRFHLPEGVIRFGGGTIGLQQHIPDFDGWRARLVPRAAEIMQSIAPDRQWSCTELLDELREDVDIPEWLTPFVLAALVKSGDELTYLGRLRVALPGGGEDESRTYVHELALQLLRDAGEPMQKDTLIASIRARIGVTDFAINQVLQRPQLVRVDLDRIGLLERDVPGGTPAINEAIEHVASVLNRRNRGLSSFDVHREVERLSVPHATWSEPLTYSVLHGDPQFRFNQSGAVGLAAWESTRVPTRLELARASLDESDGRVSVDAVMARIEAHYGERPTRALIASIGVRIGASLAGDWFVRREGGGER